MQAEIIAIGDEILIGQTLDTNSTFIANQLNTHGIHVRQKRVIADDAQAIKQALDTILPQTNLVFMTGGLGPTKDDITKKTLCEYFGGELIFNQQIYDNITRIFLSFKRELSETNRQQAYIPDCCNVFINEVGTASAMHFQKNDVHFFSTPGVPYEAEYLIERKILPWIREKLQKGNVVHKTLLTHGVPESDLADRISEWENSLPSSLKLAYLPSPGVVKLRLSSYVDDPEKANGLIDREVEKLKSMLGDIIFGEEAQTLEGVIGKLLMYKRASLSTAESCTGGYVAHLITGISGSSAYYKGSVVSYSNEAKIKMLNVNAVDLEKYGPVSQQVAEQMAAGAREKFNTEYAVATTGYAGPADDITEDQVGNIWIAIASPEGVTAKKFNFGKHRTLNIRRAALMSLDMLRKEIQKNES